MAVLLDTHALVWLANQVTMRPESIAAIDAAAADSGVYVTPISAWEVGMLVAKGRLQLSVAPAVWFAEFMAKPGIQLAPLLPQIGIEASFLPGVPPRDPADRLIVATARHFDAALVTRDRIILDYAGAGHLTAIAC